VSTTLMAVIAWRRKTTLVVYTLAMAGFMYLIAAVYPSLRQVGVDFMQALPESIRSLMGGRELALTSVPGFLAVGYNHPLVLVLFSAFVISSATQAAAGEIDRRTVDLILSRPVTRFQVLGSHVLFALLGLAILSTAVWSGTAIGVRMGFLTPAPDLQSLTLISVNLFALFFAVAGYSFLFSSLTSETGRSNALAGSLTAVFFFMKFIGDLWDRASFLKTFSIFQYYDPAGVLLKADHFTRDLVVLFVIGAVTLAGAFVVFQERDV